MADNTQAQTLTLDNGNAAQNQYLGYYNQLISQLGGNNANTVSYNAITQVPQAQAQLMQNPTQLQAQAIQSPGQLTRDHQRGGADAGGPGPSGLGLPSPLHRERHQRTADADREGPGRR